MNKYYKTISSLPLAKLWIYSLISMILFASIADLVNSLLGADLLNNPIDECSIKEQIISGVIIGPLFESILLFLIPYNVFRFFDSKPIFYILTAGLIFGVCHIYSWLYIVTMCCLGIIQAQCFSISANRKGRAFAVLILWALHGIYNVWALIVT